METEKTDFDMDEEFYEALEWTWQAPADEQKAVLTKNDTVVIFNPQFSLGTSGVRGNEPLAKAKHHYWEIQLPAELEGSHMGIGVVTSDADLNVLSDKYGDLLGIDKWSWGLSKSGKIHHNNKASSFSTPFEPGDTIGIHLDRWNGTIDFYRNNKLLGTGFKTDPETKKKLQTCELYPAAYSSANNVEMELTFAKSYEATLELHCLQVFCREIAVLSSTSLCGLIRSKLHLPHGMYLKIKSLYWWLAVAPVRKHIFKDYRDKASHSFPFFNSIHVMNDSSRYTI